MKIKNICYSVACSAILAFNLNLHAQTDALQGFSGGETVAGWWGATTGYTIGWQFQVNQNISVSALGVYDLDNQTWNTSHEVGLWTASGTLLAEATVTSADSESADANGSEIRWASLGTSLNLTAGQTYDIAAYYPSDGFTIPDYFVEGDASVTTDSTITYLNQVGSADGPFTFPDPVGGGNGFFGPNFEIAPVPEPSTLALAGLGGLGLLLLRRRK